MVWPLLRTIPNDTHASLMRRFSADIPSLLIVNGRTLQQEQVKQVELDGKLTVTSQYSTEYPSRKETNPSRPIEVTRTFFPSTELPMLCEEYVIKKQGEPGCLTACPGVPFGISYRSLQRGRWFLYVGVPVI